MIDLVIPVRTFGRSLKFCLDALEQIMAKGRMIDVAWLMLSLTLFWFIYTPVHELLHVAGCLVSGGSVSELALAPQYGGRLLQNVFPFIRPESNYAGQLTGFTTPSIWSYFVTDMAPYVLSLLGLPLLAVAGKRRSAWIAGPGFLLAFVPFMSIPGDLYEAVSLLTSPVGELFHRPGLSGYLVSDDVFKLVEILRETGQLSSFNVVMILIGTFGAIYIAIQLMAFQYHVMMWLTRNGRQFNNPD